MKREQSSQEMKWNLSGLYNSLEEWQADYDWLATQVPKINEYKGKLKDKQTLLNMYAFDKIIDIKMDKLFVFISLNHDIALKDTTFIEKKSLLDNLISKFSEASSYIEPEMSQLDDNILVNFRDDPDFFVHKKYFQSVIDSKKHVLSEKEERVMSLVGRFAGGYTNIYTTLTGSDMTFAPIIIDGKEVELTSANFVLYLENPNREVRKQAYNNFFAEYKKYGDTIANSFIYDLKVSSFDLSLRNYTSLLDACLEGAKIPQRVYYNLIENVDKNVGLMHRYFNLLKQKSQIKDFGFCDVYMSIVDSIDYKIDYEQQYETMLKALSVLGDDYISVLKQARHDKWIDVFPSKTKRGGAYSLAIYDYNPYVLLNNVDNYDSLSTMCHELGHAMHSYYSNKCQPYELAEYGIYVAEVSSTVNEILLSKYMYANAKTDKERLFFLDHFVKGAKATVFRQTMFSEFEDYAHKLVENDKAISRKILNDKYLELNKKHFGDVVEIDENIGYEWCRIPHFYRSYYVYKYATSFTTAVHIANSILLDRNNMKEKYREFLSSGASDYPNNLLKKLGVDLESNEPYDTLFTEVDWAITEMEKILSKKNDKLILPKQYKDIEK